MFVARDDINQDKFLLPNHGFDLVWGNTECNKRKTIKLAMKIIEEQQVDAIIGAGCDSCLATATIAGIYNVPMISHVRVMTLCCHFSLYSVFNVFNLLSLRKMCPYSEIFRSIFSRIWTEYGEIICIYPYSVQMRENMDQKNLRILFTQCAISSLRRS